MSLKRKTINVRMSESLYDEVKKYQVLFGYKTLSDAVRNILDFHLIQLPKMKYESE